MTDTFSNSQAQKFERLVDRIKQISQAVQDQDTLAGTQRPDGVSLGRIYETLGIHLVAMFQEKLSGIHALKLISQIAQETSDLDSATLISMLAVQDQPGSVMAAEADC